MSGTGSIDKAIDVLELVAEAGGATAAEVAAALALPLPTTYRLLRAWQRRGYVVVDQSRRYSVGNRLLRLSTGISSTDLLRNGAIAILERLTADAQVASAQIAVLDSDRAVFIARAARPQDSFRLDLDVGSAVPLNSTALGKAIIAGHSGEIGDLIGRLDLVARTDATIVEANALERECRDGAARGYWTSIAEHAADLWSVAALIGGAWDGAILAVGVSEHMWRYSRKRVPEIGAIVRSAAAELEALVRQPAASPAGRSAVQL